MKTTLISNTCNNIGQVRFSEAKSEIRRMSKQSDKIWRSDMSDQMYCPDETDDEVNNPCVRTGGFCFITCSNRVEEWND